MKCSHVEYTVKHVIFVNYMCTCAYVYKVVNIFLNFLSGECFHIAFVLLD